MVIKNVTQGYINKAEWFRFKNEKADSRNRKKKLETNPNYDKYFLYDNSTTANNNKQTNKTPINQMKSLNKNTIEKSKKLQRYIMNGAVTVD